MFKLMASHISLKSSLEAYDKVGVRISKNIRIHQALAGGPENLGCFLDHYRNYIHKARRLRMDQEQYDVALRDKYEKELREENKMDYIKLKLVELENNLLNWDDATAEKVHTTFPNAPKDGTASIPDPLLARRLGKPRTNCYKAKP
ncbi:hypothetical protein T459_23626 [Capsicum annuum]|uniref:Uncharacterized protein n=1 Tax=Capsicum annuum TaxID=4072 RepID=A0A2G2YT83_CAPAN|nr:hypothetical protein T459_23626 [Capsicum annuum]